MPNITIDNLRKEYGSLVAVDDLSLTLPEGELLVIVGPSGSGKSTALHMLSGLVEPTGGSIKFDEREVTGISPENRDISMVFQDLALYPHMTAYENVAFPLKANGTPPEDEMDKLVTEAAELVDADHLLDDKISELSGGQAQRVALARALVREPDVFLLDEPLSDLDELLKRKLRSEIAGLQQELNITTVHVTHDQEEAMTIGDRIAVMLEGQLVQIDVPREVFHNPATPFVATFIGSPEMNMFSTTVDAVDDETVVLTDNEIQFRLQGDLHEAVMAADTDDIAVGIRPDHVGWNTSAPEGDVSAVPVTVDLVEVIGTNDVVHCTTDQDREIRATFESATVAEGEEGYLTFDEDYLHLYDGHSETASRLN